MSSIFNPLDYGAKWDGVTDDRAALQAAIDNAKAVGGTVVLPAGTGAFTAPLDLGSNNLNNPRALRICGMGPGFGGTFLQALNGDAILLDCIGAKALELERFTLLSAEAPAVAGIVLASSQTYDVDMVVLRNLYVSGKFLWAALYGYAFASSQFYSCRFYNYRPQPQSAVWLSADNQHGMAGSFAPIKTGWFSTSDLSFFGCEVHDFSGQASGRALFLEGCTSVRFFGGNVSNSGGAMAYIECAKHANLIPFYGTTFYSDYGPAPAFIYHTVPGHPVGLLVFDPACSLQYTQAVRG